MEANFPWHAPYGNQGRTSFKIAWCDFNPKIKPDPAEVEQVLILALNSLLDNSIYHTEKRRYNGKNYNAPYFQFPEGKVWGATAMILSELKYILRDTT